MSKYKRLKFIGTITKQKADTAGRALAQTKQKLLSELQKLEQLKNYKKEYQKQIGKDDNGGMSASSLVNYHGFLNHINSVVGQQEDVVNKLKEEYKLLMKQWQVCYEQDKTVHSYLDKVKEDEVLSKQIKEQKEQDSQTLDNLLNK